MNPRFHSAGIVPFAVRASGEVAVFVAHMGGPIWERRDEGAWTISKGRFEPGVEAPVDAARREFVEEIGVTPPPGDLVDLGRFPQGGGTLVYAFALSVADESAVRFVESNLFEMEWPPRSGRRGWFPEMDGAAWFDVATARRKVLTGQVPVLDAVELHARGAAAL